MSPAQIRGIVEQNEKVRFDRSHFAQYTLTGLDFEIVYFVTSPDFNVYMDIQQAINLDIYSLFESNAIEFAYPTQKSLRGGDSDPQAGSVSEKSAPRSASN